jgi:hypothetical protein
MWDESETAVGTACHRTGLTARRQERSVTLVLAESLQLGPAMGGESLAVLEFHLAG